MTETIILTLFSISIAIYLLWGFRNLPAENWQILASVPVSKGESGEWEEINLTWYGLLTANAFLVSVMSLLVLLGSMGANMGAIAMLTICVLIICVPAARLVARVVENKAHTFTVGGAVFVGTLATPLAIIMLNSTAGLLYGFHLPVMATCAAVATSYAFGEGLGRLACISFGCCYGRHLDDCSGWLLKLVGNAGFVFRGGLKKAAYAGGMEGERLFPVQAVTAVLYSICGIVSTALFISGRFTASFLLASIFTQLWRIFSEFLRADYRGEGQISAYQKMGVAGSIACIATALLLPPEPPAVPSLLSGIRLLWSPYSIILLQGVWLAIFLYTGRSTVTGATINLRLHRERV